MKKWWAIIVAAGLCGCQVVPRSGNLQDYYKVTNAVTWMCLTGVTEKALRNSVLDSGTADPLDVQENYAGRTILTDASMNTAWGRGNACQRMYVRLAGLSGVFDAAGSVSSGLGGVAALLSGGAAAASTNAWIAGFAFTPVVVSEAARLEPQRANAFQALHAIEQLRCETEATAVMRDRIDPEEASATFEDADTTLLALAEAADAQARELIAEPPLAGGAEPTDTGGREPRIQSLSRLAEAARASRATIGSLESVALEVERSTDDDALALHMVRQIEQVNALWGSYARDLLPTPEQTLRRVLASPVSLTARFISGDPAVEAVTPEIAAARFNYAMANDRSAPGRLSAPDAEAIRAAFNALAPEDRLDVVQQMDEAEASIEASIEAVSAWIGDMNAILDAASPCRSASTSAAASSSPAQTPPTSAATPAAG